MGTWDSRATNVDKSQLGDGSNQWGNKLNSTLYFMCNRH